MHIYAFIYSSNLTILLEGRRDIEGSVLKLKQGTLYTHIIYILGLYSNVCFKYWAGYVSVHPKGIC